MLTLDTIKLHVRLELDFAADDSLLNTYAGAAKVLVENQTGRALYETEQDIPLDDEGEPIEKGLVINDAIHAAMLLLIGHWYANRESVVVGLTASELPMAVKALISPYSHFNL